MFDQNIERKTRLTLQRILPRIEAHFADRIEVDPKNWQTFRTRLEQHFSRLLSLLVKLYKDQYDFFYYLEELVTMMAQSWFGRAQALKDLDAQREQNPRWFHSNTMLGGVCYVDLFAGDIQGIRAKIPYFKELGLTYLHLMPLFKMPEGENDGGYAVSSYRDIHPPLGTIEQLQMLTSELRQEGISLVLDFILNHTASDHAWAQQARAGDVEYQEYFFIFPDRNMPDEYEKNLREIFPQEHPGAFSQLDSKEWVWTTFHSYQWDLNYANPAVFYSMASEMLFLANLGVDVLRFDALAFCWKQLGTTCESLPEAHLLIQAFNAVARITAPSLLFKSEAIVHPDQVAQYIHIEECQLSYNPLLMALLWNSLATRRVDLLRMALQERFSIDTDCAWVNYIRCHDDIGWTFSDEDAARLGINGFDHRHFLNAFYTGRFEGSFARGLPFQENPKTGDARISGTCASLAGLEKALKEETETEVELAIRRILLLHGIIFTIGGIPLIYLNDEIGSLNDYSYRADPAKVNDSRWVHRPYTDWERMSRRNLKQSLEGRIYQNLKSLIELRKNHSAFAGGKIQILNTNSDSVLGYLRMHATDRALVFANFTEKEQLISANFIRLYGLGYQFIDLLNQTQFPFGDISLAPYQFLSLAVHS